LLLIWIFTASIAVRRSAVLCRFYDGGFEDAMTRREAALILGVRESATPQRIKDAHRLDEHAHCIIFAIYACTLLLGVFL
jgi:hypothetical protein